VLSEKKSHIFKKEVEMKAKVIGTILATTVCCLLFLTMMVTNIPAGAVDIGLEVMEGHARWYEPIVEKFNKEHPEIKIKMDTFTWRGSFERMLTHFMGRTEPPIIEVHAGWIHRFASLGFLANLSPYISPKEIKDFWPDMVKHFQYKGLQYCIPVFADVYAYTYNGDMYREAGLDPEDPPQDWEELLEHLKGLTAPGKGQYGFGLYAKGGTHDPAVLVNMFIRQNKGSVLNEDYTRCVLNEPAAIEATRFVTDLYLKHLVCAPGALELDVNETAKVFAMGTVASYVASSVHASYTYEMNPDIDIYAAPLPQGRQWRGARMYGWGVGMSSRYENKSKAWEFIEFLVSPEMAREFIVGVGGTMGPRISVAKTSPKLSEQPYKGYVEAMEKGYGYVDPPLEQWRQIEMIEVDALQRIYLREATVEEALGKAVVEINKILSK
jgi:multiple sugar transport system substrate-binding protein